MRVEYHGLGHKSDPGHALENPTNVVNRLRRLEEPMNHILGIFFALAPSDIVHELFRRHAGIASEGPLKLLGHTVAAELQIGDLTQPDFAFEGANSFLTIEAKVGTNKSSLEQLLKYAALHAAAKKATPGRIHGLLYLSSSSQAGLFSEAFVDWSDLKRLANERLPHVKKGRSRACPMNNKPRFCKRSAHSILDMLPIRSWPISSNTEPKT